MSLNHTYRHLCGCLLILLGGYVIFTSCDGILLGIIEEGAPVQLHVGLEDLSSSNPTPNADSLDYPSADYIQFHMTEVSIASQRSAKYSFALNDSTIVFTGPEISYYMGEKVLPAATYGELDLVLGDSTISDISSLEISGLYLGEPYSIRSDTLLEVQVHIVPAINVGRNTDTLTALHLLFNRSEWFAANGRNKVLDPRNRADRDQILTNVFDSIRLEQFVTTKDETKGN